MLLKPTLAIRAISFWKIPMIYAIRPRVLELDENGCAVEIKLRRFTRNHIGIMYFGALCVAADCTAGLNAGQLILTRYKGIELLFKDLSANFLKRADGDTVLRCTQGKEIEAAVRQAYETRERVNFPVHLTATVPSKYGEEPVAKFVMNLTMKRRS